ncbi:MAG TPA: hypothetical protein VLT85_08135 [Terriglobales bacterium]|nr:hypothetical protein [Terriglobales bacterium]
MMAPAIDFTASPELRQDLGVWRRRALVAYVRALQLSQHASVQDLTADERARLPQTGTAPAPARGGGK